MPKKHIFFHYLLNSNNWPFLTLWANEFENDQTSPMKPLKIIVSIGLLLGLAGSLQAAVVVNGATTGNLTTNGFNTSPVFTTDVTTTESNQQSNRTLIQTFRVTSNFTMSGVVIEYQNTTAGYGNGTITLNLLSVGNTTLTPQTDANLGNGSVLKSWTFTSNATTRTAAGFTSSSSATSLMQWTFTGSDTFDLTTTASPGGYALQFTSAGFDNAFAWQRRTADGYAPGAAYFTTTAASTGDFALAVIPEPSTWALLAAGLTTVMVLRRRRT
jgi:hypothetical protein